VSLADAPPAADGVFAAAELRPAGSGPAAAADALAERPALEGEAAAGARGREEARLDEQGPHQGRPEKDVAEEERTAHFPVLSAGRADRISSGWPGRR